MYLFLNFGYATSKGSYGVCKELFCKEGGHDTRFAFTETL